MRRTVACWLLVSLAVKVADTATATTATVNHRVAGLSGTGMAAIDRRLSCSVVRFFWFGLGSSGR